MKTPEDVINRFINEENVRFNQERDDWMIEAMEEYAEQQVGNHALDVSVALLQSLHQDLNGFQDIGFLTPDTKRGLGIAIEQVERYMRGELKARQQ